MLINVEKIMGGLISHKDVPLVLLMCLAYIHTVASVPKMNVLNKINVCPTVGFVQNSSYTAMCSEKIFSELQITEDVDLAMCMMVYDIMNKICIYSSKIPINNDNKLSVPETAKEFDDTVKKLEPESSNFGKFMVDFCKNVPSMSNQINTVDQTESKYLTYVNGTLLKEGECPYTCHKPVQKVNPFCMILLWANELFSSVKSLKTPSSKVENLPNKNDIAPNGIHVDKERQKPNESQKGDTSNAVKEKSTKKSGEHAEEQEKDVVKPQNAQIVESNPIKDADKPDDANLNVDNINNNKPLNPSNVQSSQDETKLVPEGPKAEDVAKEEANLSPPLHNDKVDTVPKQINAPPDLSNPQNEANGENEADIQNGKIEDKIIDVDEGKEPDNSEVRQENQEPIEQVKSVHPNSPETSEEEESHSFTYFSIICLFIVGLYVGYHNKQKILAMVLEGRRSRRNRGSRRRPSTASYRKLDCNLEEAVTSQCNSNVTHVIY